MKIVVVGGAGFIGTHTVKRYQDRGADVVVIDDLSRRGTPSNLEWLRQRGDLQFARCDVRDAVGLADVLRQHADASAVVHLAGQVAVTTSVENPREDFEINACGTFNVLEAVRALPKPPLVLFASTNKVYGGMESVVTELGPGMRTEEREGRYRYRDLPSGINEETPLDFHSPYGCSKGAADQYVRDYARIYNIPTVVFRQSCIYGTRQFGIEDQGWAAWFTISAVFGRRIKIFGDGKQVRDMLYVDDLVDAYEIAISDPDKVSGKIFNIGGGASFSMSILGLVHYLEDLLGTSLPFEHFDWRPGDQPVYISDIAKSRRELGWIPKTDPGAGIRHLYDWVQSHRDLVREQLGDLLVVDGAQREE